VGSRSWETINYFLTSQLETYPMCDELDIFMARHVSMKLYPKSVYSHDPEICDVTKTALRCIIQSIM
jgi:hypothetical protein